jgi:hypothetical protein
MEARGVHSAVYSGPSNYDEGHLLQVHTEICRDKIYLSYRVIAVTSAAILAFYAYLYLSDINPPKEIESGGPY